MFKKFSQSVMVWFLPIVIIAGMFFPLLGYLVLLMMLFFLVLAYFKARFWCSNLCPRGAFLDLFLSRFSRKRKAPLFLSHPVSKWMVFIFFMSFFILQFIMAKKDLFSLGYVFVRMCLMTTLIAIILGIPIHHRTWCVICPMGNLQSAIGSLRKDSKQTDDIRS
ncbi:MAG: 4Fe-4S binding protein [Candidatus Omnitrophica bacterium]|nr:4Fe-4S binding protein [Candidatus Omnitrophota bacterium]